MKWYLLRRLQIPSPQQLEEQLKEALIPRLIKWKEKKNEEDIMTWANAGKAYVNIAGQVECVYFNGC